MRAMTTAALVLCPELPPSGLRQSMHNPTIPLKLDNIFNSPAISGMDGGIGLEITRNLISDAIKRIHAESIGYLRKQRIAFTKNETSQGTDLLWMRLAEAPWGRTIEYLLQACLHDSRL